MHALCEVEAVYRIGLLRAKMVGKGFAFHKSGALHREHGIIYEHTLATLVLEQHFHCHLFGIVAAIGPRVTLNLLFSSCPRAGTLQDSSRASLAARNAMGAIATHTKQTGSLRARLLPLRVIS